MRPDQARPDIVAIVRESGVTLDEKGPRHLGFCPFCLNTQPSLIVKADKGTYHCVSCVAHGDVYSYFGRINNLPYSEARKLLESRAETMSPLIPSSYKRGGK